MILSSKICALGNLPVDDVVSISNDKTLKIGFLIISLKIMSCMFTSRILTFYFVVYYIV